MLFVASLSSEVEQVIQKKYVPVAQLDRATDF